MLPANTSTTKSSKIPVSSSRKDQGLAGLLLETLRGTAIGFVCEERLVVDVLVAVFFVDFAAVATTAVFLFVMTTALFWAELARFVAGFPAAFLSVAALPDSDFADAATGFFFVVVFVCAADFAATLEFATFCRGFVSEPTGLNFVTVALLARTTLVCDPDSDSAMSSPKSLDRSSPPRTFAAGGLIFARGSVFPALAISSFSSALRNWKRSSGC